MYSFVERIISGQIDEIGRRLARKPKWCKRCSRTHGQHPCDLVKVDCEAKSGRTVKRWAHP